MTVSDKKISIILPCYLDYDNIDELYTRLKKVFTHIQYDYEILYVNDASPDNSLEKLKEIAKSDSKVTILNHARNFGLMGVINSGLLNCTGDCAVIMDGDLQDPPEVIPSLIERWEEGFYVVYGDHKERDESPLLVFLFHSFYKVWNFLADVNIPENAGDFSLIDRKVIDIINSLPEKERFFRGLRAWVGFPQTSVKFKRDKRFNGSSTQNIFKYFSWATFAIVSFSTKPLRLVSKFSLFMFASSSFYLIVLLVMYFMNIQGPKGFMTLIGVILILFSANFLILSILAEYFIQIFKELKSRPSSIVSEKIKYETN